MRSGRVPSYGSLWTASVPFKTCTLGLSWFCGLSYISKQLRQGVTGYMGKRHTESTEQVTGLAPKLVTEPLPPEPLLMRTCCVVARDGSPGR